MRKDDVVRDNQSRIISRQLVCNKEGWRNMRYLDLDDRSKGARSLTRTKCPARLRVKLDYGCGRWKVSCFVKSHNHDLMPPQFAHLVPTNRRLTVTDKVQVENLHNFGVKTCHIMGYIALQKGGYRHAGFTRKDLYNHIDHYHQSKVKNGDANAAINYLIGDSYATPKSVLCYSVKDESFSEVSIPVDATYIIHNLLTHKEKVALLAHTHNEFGYVASIWHLNEDAGGNKILEQYCRFASRSIRENSILFVDDNLILLVNNSKERELLVNYRYRELVFTEYDIEHGTRNLLVRRAWRDPGMPHPITVRSTLKYFAGMFPV
ncbi:hypothetical protein Ahy_A09g042292 isoform G [Arachis hypogaea]|uniref:FAR1 domain-containing protein n=1 Tax=Arachis hypogaea TaxID=3818 RepID=A0A445BFJ4_ARAHY|nr:hypothetical protein Ahy_A09g042292 isoform G [Arachis hypogaea]